MRWHERTVLYVYIALLTGWVLLLHWQGVDQHEAIKFIFKHAIGVGGS